jgi:hypothetical protein
VIRYGNTLPNWIADTSKISPQNPIIHRANPILQLAHGDIEIASVADSFPLKLPSELNSLRFECLAGDSPPEIMLTFMKDGSPTFKILRSDAELLADELLLTASPA